MGQTIVIYICVIAFSLFILAPLMYKLLTFLFSYFKDDTEYEKKYPDCECSYGYQIIGCPAYDKAECIWHIANNPYRLRLGHKGVITRSVVDSEGTLKLSQTNSALIYNPYKVIAKDILARNELTKDILDMSSRITRTIELLKDNSIYYIAAAVTKLHIIVIVPDKYKLMLMWAIAIRETSFMQKAVRSASRTINFPSGTLIEYYTVAEINAIEDLSELKLDVLVLQAPDIITPQQEFILTQLAEYKKPIYL